ncbi:hypothetical protein HNQ34_003363 [Anoxybacillus tepidamans]|uniref:Transposase n=1 Tax=Anoxybacteroides tepidamans TaxID=265948 RepID=A0A7W8IV44_9BACL|nr:hypothetical protein [Anoxybacillus tepidamans]
MKVRPNIRKENPHARALSFYYRSSKDSKKCAALFFFVSAQLPQIPFYLQRRNRHLAKQEDAVIIAIHLLGKLFGYSSERVWHRFVTGNLFTNGPFLERSRYNRRCRAVHFAIKWIRYELAKCGQHHAYAVVDSMPIEL